MKKPKRLPYCVAFLLLVLAGCSKPSDSDTQNSIDQDYYNDNVHNSYKDDDEWRNPAGNAYLIESGHVGDIYLGDADRHEFGGGRFDSQNRLILRKQLMQCYEECQFAIEDVIDVVTNENETLVTIHPDKIDAKNFYEDYFMTIDAVEIQSKKFKTKEGVGIGTSYDTFMKEYADHIEVVCYKESNCYISVKDKNLDNIRFFFNYDLKYRLYTNMALDDDPEGKVTFGYAGAVEKNMVKIEVSNILLMKPGA